MNTLEGKIAVVTGANSGIGFATARRFAEAGATVVLTGRRREAVEEAAATIGGSAVGLVADAADLGATDRLVEEIRERFGRIDVLFLNAGIAPFAGLEEQTPEAWDDLFATNVRGPYFTLQKALPLLSEGASVFFNSSVVNVKGFPGTSAYSATKAAVRSLVRTLAAELAPRGIRVNSVAPGPIDTPIYGKLGMSEAEVQELGEGFAQQVPLGRFGRSEEVATAALFLASSASSFVNGTEIPVDGGLAQV